MNQVYVVGRITVRDAEKWAEYRKQVPATLAPWGAEVVFRGKQLAALAGADSHPDIVAIRFPCAEAVQQWFASPDYQTLIPLREQAAEIVLLVYEA